MTATAAVLSFSLTAEEVMRDIDSVDLYMVKRKLMDEEEGQGWTQDQVDFVEKRYRRYLCMIRLDPNGSAVPTKDIDLFWHQHILDTRAYAKDCEHLFGYFLHHFPYFGMRGEEDARNLSRSFEETKALYALHFGEDYCEQYADADASRCHKCSPTCHKCQSGCGMKCTKCTSK
ncbi:MAG: hypothetical protein DMF56_11895 [Acidobacteria bacterium]|nr:MAG: hypothetical protein DMF56_11895 [Acidobacteriota bacterium]